LVSFGLSKATFAAKQATRSLVGYYNPQKYSFFCISAKFASTLRIHISLLRTKSDCIEQKNRLQRVLQAEKFNYDTNF